jgi:protein O-mannosyl-transferase
LLALVVLTLAAYQPAWRGGMLWDDEKHLTAPALQSVDGLQRIWTELGATQQYYPIVHSAFWLEHQLWGDRTLGYHVVNITLHATSAFLIFLVVRRLALPGAAIAAFLFALHPVHVESVAWMTELKNTLSGVFYLGAALAYLRFDDGRARRPYVMALFLFVLALMSKSVTATLPASLLVVCWWRRGRIDWRRDVLPLVPFLVIGVSAGLFTAWVERTAIGAQGPEFDWTPIERVLIAGRAIWFYLLKLVWPWPLIFTYPRWQIRPDVWWQYLFPLAVVAAFALLWWYRARSRAPLAVALLFCGALFPALGFLNVFPFRFSYVADHFQYLATIPAIVFASAGVAVLTKRWSMSSTAATVAAVIALGGPAFALTHRQSRQYVDAETLYRTTLRLNESSWMAHNNLSLRLLDGSVDEALAHAERAIALKPNHAEAHNNLGNAWHRKGRLDEALAAYSEARRLDPNLPESRNNLCRVLVQLGQAEQGRAECEAALRLRPDYVDATCNLGLALDALGRPHDALDQYARTLRLDPSYFRAHYYQGGALFRLGRPDEAVAAYREATRLSPQFAPAHNDLGVVLRQVHQIGDAIAELQEAVRINPDYVDARFNLANTLQSAGRLDEAAAQYSEVVARSPNDASARNNFGVALEALGRLRDALVQYQEAFRLNPSSVEARQNVSRLIARIR